MRRPEASALLRTVIERAGQYGSEEEARFLAASILIDRGELGRADSFAVFARQADEGAALIESLRADLSTDIVNVNTGWTIFRLGDKRERRAIEVLARWIAARPMNGLGTKAAAALIKIGRANADAPREVEAAVRPLLDPPHPHETRAPAQQALVALGGKRALPLLRRALREDVGVKWSAADAIGSLGTAADIALIEPLADFWSGDRVNHRPLQDALAQLRERHGYDLNTPTRRAGT